MSAMFSWWKGKKRKGRKYYNVCNKKRDNQNKKLRRLLSQIHMVTDNEYLSSWTCGIRSLEDAHAAKFYNVTHLILTIAGNLVLTTELKA